MIYIFLYFTSFTYSFLFSNFVFFLFFPPYLCFLIFFSCSLQIFLLAPPWADQMTNHDGELDSPIGLGI